MEKRLISIFALLIIGTVSLSCESDGTSTSQEAITVQELGTSNQNFARGRENGIVFEFSTKEEAMEFLEDSLSGEVLGIEDQMRNYPTAVSYTAQYEFSNGQVLLKKYGFVDAKDAYVEEFIFNENLDTYETNSGAPVEPGCPDGGGWSNLGTCNDLETLQPCMAAKAATFAMQNMHFAVSDVGSGVAIFYVKLSTGIRICGKIY